jgi:hypothetical protein
MPIQGRIALPSKETVSGLEFLSGPTWEITNASLHGAQRRHLPEPDAVAAQDGAAYPLLAYDNGNGYAALAVVDPCDAGYRAVYLALQVMKTSAREPAAATR